MTNFSDQDKAFMQRAYDLALKAESVDEVPVGAVLVLNNEIIGEGFNSPINNNDPTAHAEIQAIRQASEALQNYRLPTTTLYVTLEPCAMCAGALVHARIQRLVFAAKDAKTGACGSQFNVISSNNKNHRVKCENGLMASESAQLISDFFSRRRTEKKAIKNNN